MIIINDRSTRARIGVALAALALAAGGLGYYLGSSGGGGSPSGKVEQQGGRKVLYYYDPMVPQEHYDQPGLSSMGMQTIPKYADAGGEAAGVRVDPSAIQSLGI